MQVTGPHFRTAPQCELILRALPDWFGIEEAIVNYVKAIDDLPTFLAHDGNDANVPAIGFITVKRHFQHAAELYVLGVRAEHHRRGVGRALLDAVESWLRLENVRFLQVKTVSAAGNSTEYDETRKFYTVMGFQPLEEFPTLWSPRNPCLLMVKAL